MFFPKCHLRKQHLMTTRNSELQTVLQQPQGQVNGKDGVIVRVRNKCSFPSLASSPAFHYVPLRPSGDWDFQPRAQLMTTQHPRMSLSFFFWCCIAWRAVLLLPIIKPAFGLSSMNPRLLNYLFFLLVLFPSTPSILSSCGLIAYVYDPTRGRKQLVVYSVICVQINYIVIKHNHYKKLYGNNLKVKDPSTEYKWRFHKLEWRKTWHLNVKSWNQSTSSTLCTSKVWIV